MDIDLETVWLLGLLYYKCFSESGTRNVSPEWETSSEHLIEKQLQPNHKHLHGPPYPHCVEWFILMWLWMTLVERVARTRVKLAYEELSGEGRHLTELDFRTLKSTDGVLGIHAM